MKFNLLIILTLVISCHKPENKSNENTQKETLLIAKQELSDFRKLNRTFTIFSDSSYTFKEIIKDVNYNKEESFEGMLKIKNDTINFFPFELDYNEAETAVLKNGFIEFIDGEQPDRMKIENTSLKVNNHIDFKNYKDYAVFTDYKKFSNDNQNQSVDLTTNDLRQIDNILKVEFQKNKRFKKYSDYLKQISALKNEKNEITVGVHFYCKSANLSESFQYFKIGMMDGGNCNVFIKLNLTKGKIELVNIAGLA